MNLRQLVELSAGGPGSGRRPSGAEMGNYHYHAANHGRDSKTRPTWESTSNYLHENTSGGVKYSAAQKDALTKTAVNSYEYFHR